jgi:hypothetical protein
LIGEKGLQSKIRLAIEKHCKCKTHLPSHRNLHPARSGSVNRGQKPKTVYCSPAQARIQSWLGSFAGPQKRCYIGAGLKGFVVARLAVLGRKRNFV